MFSVAGLTPTLVKTTLICYHKVWQNYEYAGHQKEGDLLVFL